MAKKRSSSSAKHGRHWDIVRFLIILGAIVAIIQAILILLSPSFPGVILAILAIVIAVLLLSSVGVVHTKLDVTSHWLIVIILAIILIVLGTWWGGLIVLIGGIIDLVDNL